MACGAPIDLVDVRARLEVHAKRLRVAEALERRVEVARVAQVDESRAACARGEHKLCACLRTGQRSRLWVLAMANPNTPRGIVRTLLVRSRQANSLTDTAVARNAHDLLYCTRILHTRTGDLVEASCVLVQ